MELTIEQAIDRLAQRSIDHSNYIRRASLQRRDQVTDLHGVEFTRSADPSIPAQFFVTLSRDMTYLEMFEFKLIIQPYTQLAPNVQPVIVPVADSGYRVSVDGIDVSAYLAAQHNGWIGGEGIYPSTQDGINYDLLEAACDMRAAGRIADAERIVAPGYKRIQVSGKSLFNATLVLFLKHAHVNR